MFADVRRHLSRASPGDATHEEGDGRGHGVNISGGLDLALVAGVSSVVDSKASPVLGSKDKMLYSVELEWCKSKRTVSSVCLWENLVAPFVTFLCSIW